MNAKPVLMLSGVGLLGYLLYRYHSSASAAAAALPANYNAAAQRNANYSASALNAGVPGVSFAPSSLQPGILQSTLTAVPATTAAQVNAAVSFWGTLTPVVPLASGYIVFPSGAQAAASLFGGGNTAMDGGGNLYVSWAGNVYQLGDRDSAGNYPALLVTA